MADNVERWLKRYTPRTRKALDSASRHFDGNDRLTVNTLEAVYGQESSFGTMLGTRGSSKAAGHFQLKPETARRYGLNVSTKNDQRFDIQYAVSAAARYLKDLDTMFGKKTSLGRGLETTAVRDAAERKRFALGAYNAGEGRVATAQRLAAGAGRNPQLWTQIAPFLEAAGADPDGANETRRYVERVPAYEVEFAQKSPANKKLKQRAARTERARCTDGHWVTIEDRPVFLCD